MKVLKVEKTQFTKVNFERNKENLKRDISRIKASGRIKVLDITKDSFYAVCTQEMELNWCRYMINFHYVNSVKVTEI